MDLELFMQRFVHRKDYYAVQRVGKGRCYYQPQKNLCPNVVKQHLKGQRTIGCYARADSTTKWLVVDIDTKDLSELRAVQDRFDSLKLPYLLEFSGSKGFQRKSSPPSASAKDFKAASKIGG